MGSEASNHVVGWSNQLLHEYTYSGNCSCHHGTPVYLAAIDRPLPYKQVFFIQD